MKHYLLSLIVAVFTFSTRAAPVYNVNFTSDNAGGINITPVSGAGEGPFSTYSGTTWNNFAFDGFTLGSFATSDILDSEGNTSTVDFSLTSGGFSGGFAFGASVSDPVRNYIFSANGGDFNITGLAASTDYQVYVIGQGDVSGQGLDFTLEGENGTSVGTNNSTAGYSLGVNYTVVEVTSNGSGELSGTWAPVGANAVINGFQIVTIPEPSTILLVGLAGSLVFMVSFRRRR